jgi:uncharacterized membrane protein
VSEEPQYRHAPAPPDVCYVKQPVAGWTATIDPEAKAGFVFLMDYNELSWLYNCVGNATTEWMYDRVVLPPGKEWNTRYVILPFKGLDSVAHAGINVIASITPRESEENLELEFGLVRSMSNVVKGRITGDVRNLITGEVWKIPEFEFDELTDEPVRYACKRPGPLLNQVLVCPELELELADGSKVKERFEWFYGGRLGFSGQNLRLDLSPIYVIPFPEKKRSYIKPDRIVLTPHEGFNMLWVQGMFFDYFGIDQAAKLLDAKVIESEPYGGLLSEGLLNFPMSYDELMKLDVIVLADVSAGAIDDNTAERIKDFVEAGGGLLVFGGPWSLGKGMYAGGKIGDLLPVDIAGISDFRTVNDPVIPVGSAKLFSGMPWDEKPRCYVIQEVKPRAGAEVLMKCGDYPAMVMWKRGRGRVAVVPLTPMGEPSEKTQTPWWSWSHWPEALSKTLILVSGKK